MMIRAELLQQIGGFDGDSFFMYGDDVDFSWRARLAGYQVIHQPSARVFHDKRIQVDGRLVGAMPSATTRPRWRSSWPGNIEA